MVLLAPDSLGTTGLGVQETRSMVLEAPKRQGSWAGSQIARRCQGKLQTLYGGVLFPPEDLGFNYCMLSVGFSHQFDGSSASPHRRRSFACHIA